MKKEILKKLGLKKNWIYEVIVTTFRNGIPNAAPMGISTKDFKTINLEVYKTSDTYNNILKEREFCINFTDDFLLFYRLIMEREILKYKKAKRINAPVLMDTPVWLGMGVSRIEKTGQRVKIRSKIMDFGLNRRVRLINRAESLAFECLINATKIPHISDSDREFLKKEILKNYKAIKKVAPNSEYEKVVKKLHPTLCSIHIQLAPPHGS